MARCSTVYGALAYMRSRMQWITSSGSVADLDRGAATFLQVNIAERWSDAALLRRGRIEVRLDGIRIYGSRVAYLRDALRLDPRVVELAAKVLELMGGAAHRPDA